MSNTTQILSLFLRLKIIRLKTMCPQGIFLFYFPLPQVPLLFSGHCRFIFYKFVHGLLLFITSIFAWECLIPTSRHVSFSSPASWWVPVAVFCCSGRDTEASCGQQLNFGGMRRKSSDVTSFHLPTHLTSDHRYTVLDVHVIGVAALVHFAGASVPQDEAAHSDSK